MTRTIIECAHCGRAHTLELTPTAAAPQYGGDVVLVGRCPDTGRIVTAEDVR